MGEQRKAELREEIRQWFPEEAREHLKAARTEAHESVKALFPPEYVKHRKAARREALLAARSLIDHILERLEEGKES